MQASNYFKLLRPLNCAIAGIAAVIGYWISLSKIALSTEAFLAFLAVFLVCGAGQAVNDYFDLEIDRKKKAKRILTLGKVKAHNALAFSVVLFLAGITLALSLGTLPFIIALFMSLLLLAYSAFPKFKIAGNWIVALGTAMTLVFGAAITGSFGIVFWLFWPMLFANLARELIKDLEDLKADEGVKKTLPMLVGLKRAKNIVGVYYTLAILFAFYAFAFGIVKSTAYVGFVFLAAIVFFLSALQVGKNNFKKAQALSKVGMLLALLAFLAVLF